MPTKSATHVALSSERIMFFFFRLGQKVQEFVFKMNVSYLIKFITDNNSCNRVAKFHNPGTSLKTTVIHEHLARSVRENLSHPQSFPSRLF